MIIKKERGDMKLRVWEEEEIGQDRAMDFLILCSLRPTKHEIIFISISSTPMGAILILVPGDCLMKLKEE